MSAVTLRSVWTLYVSRHLCAHLCIASLLIGNVAGWMHLGCVESASSCCVHSDSKVTVTEARRHSCCHHSHGHSTSHAHSAGLRQDTNQRLPADNANPAEQGCPDDHDSDRCSICQSFFASRHAAFIVQLPLFGTDHQPRRVVIHPSRWQLQQTVWNGISVRGPPRV